MKSLQILICLVLLGIIVLPTILAVDVGTVLTPTINTQDFPPLVWMCDHRVVYDDNTEPGRISLGGSELIERINNYAFEGEQIQWSVLVMDKNGANKVEDVFVTVGPEQGTGNDIEANCVPATNPSTVPENCNARIGEEDLTGTQFNPGVMQMYICTFTVEPTAAGMYGEYWVTVEADDLGNESGAMAENEYWFFNPTIALSIDGNLEFDNALQGASTYSKTILVGNDADDSSGVMMDMFISGTDFYDSSTSGAMCPTTNQLALSNFAYFATNGAYSTLQDPRNDAEGYVGIEYGIGFNNPNPFYKNNEIIQAQMVGPYYTANILAPGAEMALTFRLNLPEPCNGNFDTGSIYFWGEAI